MKISAVIVCVNYGDFLSYTLPQNKPLFEQIVVVTSSKDYYTQAVCEFNNVKCVVTDSFYENGASFNKANGINAGFDALGTKNLDWILHMVADIWLPATFRAAISCSPLNESFLYGIDRMMCPNYESFKQFFSNQKPIHEGWVYQHMDFFPVGARFIQYKEDGYIPLGFFQLFHRTKFKYYPNKHLSAARTDLQFSQTWERSERALIPEVIAVHLESEERDDQSINWNGRKTIPFGDVPIDFVLGKHKKKNIEKEVKQFWKLNKNVEY